MSIINLQNVSKFQIYGESADRLDYFDNLTTENLLLSNYNLKPYQDLTDTVIQKLTSAYEGLTEYKTVFTNFLKNTGRTREVDMARVRWKLRGHGKIQSLAKGNLQAGNAYPGLNFSDILLWLDDGSYRDGDTLGPEIEPRVQVIVQGDGVAEGDGYRYVARLLAWDGNEYLDPSFLADGTRWKKVGSSKYSEGSRGYGSTRFGGVSWVEFETDLSKTGKTMEFTDEAHKVNLRVTEFMDSTYNKLLNLPDQFLTLAEAEFIAQTEWEKECDLMWGRSSRAIIDTTTGLHRRIGPGLFEFLEDGNTSYYSPQSFSIEVLEEMLKQLWFDRLPLGQGNITVYTGLEGLKLAHQAIVSRYGDTAVVSRYDDYVNKVNDRVLEFKSPQFRMYQIPNYGTITFEHWAALDSMSQGGPRHPQTGSPLTSYEMIILDYGLNAGGSGNVELLNRKNSRIYSYMCGAYTPLGANTGGKFPMVHPGRSFQLFHGDEYGLRVNDITATVWLRPNIV
jgi:hypothetical protein